ncbi:PAS domain S-box protein [Gallaecimonas pentaromativorans]|uniref:hybrid sensor histidine kinase/response regulator n=1 Tax=Gallaecimonas pentaromativorans TaxID=584787 RepID=UPI003A95316F
MAGLFPKLITLRWQPGQPSVCLEQDGQPRTLSVKSFFRQCFQSHATAVLRALRLQLASHNQAVLESQDEHHHHWLSAIVDNQQVQLQVMTTLAGRDSTLLQMADELCGIGYWHWQLRDNRFFWSPQIYQIHGLSPSHPVTLDDTLSHYHPEDQPQLRALMAEVTAGPVRRQFQGRIQRADGQWRRVSVKGVSVSSDGGAVTDVFGVVQDITHHQQSQAKMHRLALVAAQTASGALICDKQRRVEWLNSAFERLTGYGLDDLYQKRPRDFLAGTGTDPATLERVGQAMERHQLFQGDLLNYRKDGTPIWLNLSITPIYHEMQHDGFVVIVNDVSARRASEDRLRLYEQAFDQASLGLLFLHQQNGQLWVKEANSAAKELLAGPSHSLVDMPFPGDFFVRAPLELMETEGESLELSPRRAPDDSLQLIHTPLIRPGQAAYRLVILRDTTEQRRTERLLAHNQRMELIGQLVSGIAHDFNNIIGIIQGNLELLAGRLDAEHPGMRSVDKALKAASRASTLTRRLTQFSRQEPVNNEQVEAYQLLLEAEELLSPSLGKHIALEIELDTQSGSVKVDRGDFTDAIVNLAINARDAIGDKGTIRLSCMPVLLGSHIPGLEAEIKPGSYVEFGVSDDGEGIAPAIMDKILDPFFTTKPKGQGTGLGLSMVYGFVKRSKGYLQVRSEPGQGTQIHIWLPQSTSGQPRPQADDRHLDALKGKKLLLVDDENDLLQVMADQLSLRGFAISAFDDPLKAQKAMADTAFDLLLCDVEMPGLSGFELAEAFMRCQPGKPVLLMSGFLFSVPPHLAHLPRLSKPVSVTRLLGYLVTLLNKREAYGQPHSCRG